MTAIETVIIGLIILLFALLAFTYKALKQYYDKVTIELYDRITELESKIKK